MIPSRITRLRDCIGRYQLIIPTMADVAAQLQSLTQGKETSTVSGVVDRIIKLYDQCYPLFEKAMWHSELPFNTLLDDYQSLFREQDALIRHQAKATGEADKRYRFVLSIPVADRPAHLRTCLESIFQLCEKFGYGGKASGYYTSIKVIVAEDSEKEENIRQHIDLVDEYRQKGLQVFHFGQTEQYERLQSLPNPLRQQLGSLLTTQTKEKFYLKGQAANRNLSYLKCLQLTEDKDKTLYYLVDSDQAFYVNRLAHRGEERVYAVNYFRTIDKLFRTTETLVLTGKLVGDPPVSPAVMAANFLDDIIAFFSLLAATQPHQTCQFHDLPVQHPGHAAYHDMAKLFGVENTQATYPYRCKLEGEHDNAACLSGLSERLNAFLFGEHLTRRTFFSYNEGLEALTPARTIYPGNYIVNYAGLKYIIPFGRLRLRMSGPTAGRLIAAEIGRRFASANLPMLHERTTQADRNDDFRPGVERRADDQQEIIDISNEFERQFFGDLMLFSTEALVRQADINKAFDKDTVMTIVNTKEQELLTLYQQKHDAVLEKNRQLKNLVFDADRWWVGTAELTGSLKRVEAFIDNIDQNFGAQSSAWQQIQSADHRAERKQQIVEALINYRSEREAWDQLFT